MSLQCDFEGNHWPRQFLTCMLACRKILARQSWHVLFWMHLTNFLMCNYREFTWRHIFLCNWNMKPRELSSKKKNYACNISGWSVATKWTPHVLSILFCCLCSAWTQRKVIFWKGGSLRWKAWESRRNLKFHALWNTNCQRNRLKRCVWTQGAKILFHCDKVAPVKKKVLEGARDSSETIRSVNPFGIILQGAWTIHGAGAGPCRALESQICPCG